MFKKKFYTALLGVLIVIGSVAFSNSAVNAASEGWEYSNDTWYYYQDGIKVQEGWVKDFQGWGYIKDGSLMQEGWAKDSEGWRYIKGSYLMQEGWAMGSEGWSYIKDGYLMQEGWAKDFEGLRYIKDGYLMQEGWAKDSEGWHYIKGGYLMQEGWAKDPEGWRYIKGGSLMQEGWAKDSEGWRYIKDGYLMQEGWAKDPEGWRYIKNGYLMQEGWAKNTEGWRYIKDGYLVQEGWAKDSKGWGYIQNGYLAKASMWAVDSRGWVHIDNNGYWDGQTIEAVPLISTPITPTVNVNENIKISFINVGQAESILIQQGSYSMLIDAAYDIDGATVKNYISGQGISQLDYVIGTHPHEDHIGGLGYIINSFKIGKIFMPKVIDTTQIFENLMTIIKNKNMTITTPVPGSTFKLGEANCTILGPVNTDPNDLNTYSIVLKITFGNNSFLLTGDSVKSNEQAMSDAGYNLSADVLKVGHHGVFNSTSQAFLDKVNPKYAVISVGKDNLNGPPAPEVLTRLYNNQIDTFRTDLNGTIICKSDGNNITFNTAPSSFPENIKTSNIQITDLDLNRKTVAIRNNSKKDQEMTGWKIVSVEGDHVYYFPENYTLPGETTITIASGDAEGKAKLYDNNGEVISIK